MGFTISHKLHQLRRAAIDPYFSKKSVLQLERIIRAKTNKLCEVVTTYQEAKKPMNLTSKLLATTMDIITEYAFADCYNLLDNEELSVKWGDTITCVMKNTALINHFGWLPRIVESLPPGVSQALGIDITMVAEYKSVRHPDLVRVPSECPRNVTTLGLMSLISISKQRIKSQVQRILDPYKSHTNPNGERQAMFDLPLSNPDLPPSEKELQRLTDEGTILLIAASETPAKVLSLILFHLINAPATMDTLRAELDRTRITSGNSLGLSHLEQLPYMTAVIKEGLRLHNGITARSQRIAPSENLHYKGWIIPAGTPLSSISYFIHYDAGIFPEPKMFQPERWLATGTERLDKYLVAFGRGTRNCVGTNLGMAELYILLAALVGKFEMDLFETDRGDVDVKRD